MKNSYISLPKSASKLALKFMGIKNSRHIHITDIFIDDYSQNIEMIMHSTSKYSICPYCHKRSYQIRSKYIRTLKGLPLMSYGCKLRLTVKRFKCKNPKCKHKIFSETFPDLTKRYSRVTNNLNSVLVNILIEVSARKGSYITNILKIKRSPSSCIRTVSKLNIPTQYGVEHIGIDDWANRKGLTYGTILVNTLTGRPIDLINSREKKEVSLSLKKYKNLITVTRDRAAAYSAAIKEYHPEAIQIADKFHLVKNLSNTMYEIIRKNYKTIISDLEDFNVKSSTSSVKLKTKYDDKKHETECVKNRKNKFEAIHYLNTKGTSYSEIAKTLKMSRDTIRKYLSTNELQNNQITYRNSYIEYLKEIKKCCNKHMIAKEIYETIKKNGFKGKQSAFYQWFKKQFPEYLKKTKHFRKGYEGVNLIEYKKVNEIHFISARILSFFISSEKYGLNTKTGKISEQYLIATKMIQDSQVLSYLKSIHKEFRYILNNGNKEDLIEWLKSCEESTYKRLNSFANTIKKDIEPVLNALKYEYTNGIVEGNVNRLKTKKREMYGRAGFELLKRKVCLSVCG